MHELTKNYDLAGVGPYNVVPYVHYICAVLNLYTHLCLSANTKAIRAIYDAGIDESHILCCLAPDTSRSTIHEKLKQQYMQLARVIYVQNEARPPGSRILNRCYGWAHLSDPEPGAVLEEESNYAESSDDEDRAIVNDFYAGKKFKKMTQMDDPENSMIVLRHEQDTKDLFLIRKMREDMLWFLRHGPRKTDDFFYCHHERTFKSHDLKVKIKSLKIYLDAVIALLQEDCVNAKFVNDVLFVCQCAMLGIVHFDAEEERGLPAIIKSTWPYILCWLAKDIVLNQKQSRTMRNGLRAIEERIVGILEALSQYRLNLQVLHFLKLFFR